MSRRGGFDLAPPGFWDKTANVKSVGELPAGAKFIFGV
jgi:hypothetical protein